jgi:hypothetical protein
MVDLSRADFIGKGSSRVCFVHPEDHNKCIKIAYSGNLRVVSEEMKYYRRYLRRGVSWDMLARTYGFVDTSLGRGVVFSLAHDFDGEISKSLDFYLRGENGHFSKDDLGLALMEFKAYLFNQRILVRELKPDNLVYQRLSSGRGRIILVDGIGNNELLPVANYLTIFARRTLSRKWRKFEQCLREMFESCNDT